MTSTTQREQGMYLYQARIHFTDHSTLDTEINGHFESQARQAAFTHGLELTKGSNRTVAWVEILNWMDIHEVA
jgi:hypothetical protein